MFFRDRRHAGTLLTQKLTAYRGTSAIVLGLPRGGVVVAATVAKELSLPLDVLVVKKVGSPINPEFAIGALAPNGVATIHWSQTGLAGADEDYVKSQIANLNDQIKQKLLLYRKGKKALEVKGKTAIVVDDGVATGATMEAAVAWCRKKAAKRVVVAVPVAPPEFVGKITSKVDELIVLDTPEGFSAVGQFYENFEQVGDEEVVALLRESL